MDVHEIIEQGQKRERRSKQIRLIVIALGVLLGAFYYAEKHRSQVEFQQAKEVEEARLAAIKERVAEESLQHGSELERRQARQVIEFLRKPVFTERPDPPVSIGSQCRQMVTFAQFDPQTAAMLRSLQIHTGDDFCSRLGVEPEADAYETLCSWITQQSGPHQSATWMDLFYTVVKNSTDEQIKNTILPEPSLKMPATDNPLLECLLQRIGKDPKLFERFCSFRQIEGDPSIREMLEKLGGSDRRYLIDIASLLEHDLEEL